ncbi:hypothetical protein [Humidisolicoccus flavus]|uniref:hypothetical protein n=1 Tax=Humidisolicoccus flavus TaxID=3111414 RepID=UPI00324A301D
MTPAQPNFRALREPATESEREDFRRWRGQYPRLLPRHPAFALLSVMLGIGFALTGFGGILMIADGNAVGWAILTFIVATVGAIATILWLRRRSAEQQQMALYLLAKENDWEFLPERNELPLSGMIFSYGGTTQNILMPDEDTEIARHSFDVEAGKHSQRYTYTYIAFRLQRSLPHIVLDAKGNNLTPFGGSLPTLYKRSQQLELEGDFNRYFTLYVPDGFGPDALYIFTPDLMQLLIEHASNYDVEIIGNWMILFTRGAKDLTDPELHGAIWKMKQVLGAKTRRQTRWYRDERNGALPLPTRRPRDTPNSGLGVVSAGGRRLRTVGTGAQLLIAAAIIGVPTALILGLVALL